VPVCTVTGYERYCDEWVIVVGWYSGWYSLPHATSETVTAMTMAMKRR
jgi:hypothetical protein